MDANQSLDARRIARDQESRLAAAALEDARREDLDVVPLCPFIAHYIERHPEYEQLVVSGYREN